MKERIQKYMARCGIASRRKCEEIIKEGRVKINDKVIDEVVLIEEGIDVVKVDDNIIEPQEKNIYIMLNKPCGIITTAKDEFERKTILDLISINERVYPVGRLDYDTSGLLIVTNDGDLTYQLTHPSHEVKKVYVAEVIGMPNNEELEAFKKGLKIEDYVTSKAEIDIIENKGKASVLKIAIHEGKNRQVRKMCEKINHPVLRLKRVKIGDLSLGSLKEGEWRYLTPDEIKYLKSI